VVVVALEFALVLVLALVLVVLVLVDCGAEGSPRSAPVAALVQERRLEVMWWAAEVRLLRMLGRKWEDDEEEGGDASAGAEA
jgi:hypothetical protein